MFVFRDESDTDYDELSDGEISKLLIVTQTPVRPRKHEGFDRTGDYTSRAQMTSDLASAINDGLYYYEQDLWKDLYAHGYDVEDEDEESWVRTLRYFFVQLSCINMGLAEVKHGFSFSSIP